MPPRETILHASCVALNGNGLLIRGASGSGKSALALSMMAYGADLVADDRVLLSAKEDYLIAEAPPAIAGLIEARGIGILKASAIGSAQVRAIVDLDHITNDRLPEPSVDTILGTDLPLFHAVRAPHFPPALLQYLKSGLREPS